MEDSRSFKLNIYYDVTGLKVEMHLSMRTVTIVEKLLINWNFLKGG